MLIDNYAAKVYNRIAVYHWHCTCPVCNNTTRYLSFNMNIKKSLNVMLVMLIKEFIL